MAKKLVTSQGEWNVAHILVKGKLTPVVYNDNNHPSYPCASEEEATRLSMKLNAHTRMQRLAEANNERWIVSYQPFYDGYTVWDSEIQEVLYVTDFKNAKNYINRLKKKSQYKAVEPTISPDANHPAYGLF